MADLIRRFFRAFAVRKLPTTYTAPTTQTEAYFEHARVTLPPPGDR